MKLDAGQRAASRRNWVLGFRYRRNRASRPVSDHRIAVPVPEVPQELWLPPADRSDQPGCDPLKQASQHGRTILVTALQPVAPAGVEPATSCSVAQLCQKGAALLDHVLELLAAEVPLLAPDGAAVSAFELLGERGLGSVQKPRERTC